ncbi:MAG: hypothetical protein UX72_C0002G0026 [Parcubacteria group bacterium GW2011_GWA2_47_10]|nr:MAG: hypothetical protein UX72_C0002G0026 [Parcubacteria group bacterium GW2011_GWA2_47_10]
MFLVGAIFGARYAAFYYYKNRLAAYWKSRYESAKQNFSLALKFDLQKGRAVLPWEQ